MMRAVIVALVLLTLVVSKPGVSGVASDEPAVPLRPVHTFSIVARAPATDELGVAVRR